MDSSLSVRVFDWRGDIYLVVDRIHSAPRRKYAARDRLATFHATPVRDVPEDVACLWMLEQLTLWVNAGCPYTRHASATGAPLGGPQGARAPGAPSGPRPAPSLRSKTEPPPLEDSGAVGVSDGLAPPGVQPPLF